MSPERTTPQPDPSDVDTSGRGETQPKSGDAARDYAEQADRIEEHNQPAGDAAAVHGSGDRDDADAATAGRGPSDPRTTSNETDASSGADVPQPNQPHPESSKPSRPRD